MSWFTLFLGLLASEATAVESPDATNKGHAVLTVTLKNAPSTGDGTVNLLFEVSSTQSHKFCIWQTPLEGFSADVLEVLDADGNPADYTGTHIKRGKPDPSDYLTLKPNTPAAETFDLAKEYDVSKKGTYTVQFEGNEYINELPDSNVLQVEVR